MLLLVTLFPPRAIAQSSQRKLWVPNGPVFASQQLGDTLYIGGWFTRLSPPLGPCVPFSRSTGAPAPVFPEIPGTVLVMTPDGHGGWFIGGRFPRVGNASRWNVAHVRSDFTVSDWSPEVTRSAGMTSINAIAVRGDVVYIGGDFDHVNGVPRNYLAAIDGVTGALLPWDATADGEVLGLLVQDSLLYVGGAFQSLNGDPHRGLGAVNVETGVVEPWSPAADSVRCMIVDGDRLYIAGGFDRVDWTVAHGVAVVSRTTGDVVRWFPYNLDHINSIVMAGDYVYVDGANAFHKVTAERKAWDPQPGGGRVFAAAVAGNTLYAGGSFTSIGGQPRNGLAAIDLDTAQATDWDPGANIAARALCVGDSMVYAGGDFSWANGVERYRLAAIDLTTGRPAAWNPDAEGGPVRALAVTNDEVYVGGEFRAVGGEARNGFASVDRHTGEVSSLNLPLNGPSTWYERYGIRAMLVHGTTLYVGGMFSDLGVIHRNSLAAIDIPTGTLLPFNPDIRRIYPDWTTVTSLAIVDTTIYIGGDFEYVGDELRSCLAAIGAVTGRPTAWNPQIGRVNALVVRGGKIFVGGDFTLANGVARRCLAQFDLDTGELTPWNPAWSPGIVDALVADDVWLYAGGVFPRLVAIDQSTADVADWGGVVDERDLIPLDVSPRVRISYLMLESGNIYASAAFQASGGSPLGWFFVAPSALETLPTPVLTASGRAEVLPAGVRLTWTDLPARAEAIVYRRTGTTAWSPLGRASADYAGRLEYEDDAAPGPERYAYRLGIATASGEAAAGETWIDVPGLSTGLVMANPHRVSTALDLSFGLASDGPATIEVFDAQGRVVLREKLGTLARGAHHVAVKGATHLRQGLYFVRLARREGAQVRRLVVTD